MLWLHIVDKIDSITSCAMLLFQAGLRTEALLIHTEIQLSFGPNMFG